MKTIPLPGLTLALIGLLLAACLAGCSGATAVRVQPWQRATLASYSMNPNRDPLASSMTEHIYFSREAASGGNGVGGSGCGCN